MKTFEEFINEGKLKAGNGSTSIDIEFSDFDDPEVAKDLKKYRLKAKRSNKFSPHGGHEDVTLTGAKKDILAYITSNNYSGGTDPDDWIDQFPNLFEAAGGKERVLGTFKKDKNVKVIAQKGSFGGMSRLNIFVVDGADKQVVKRGVQLKATDKEIIKDLTTGPWAKSFAAAGGVNWVA